MTPELTPELINNTLVFLEVAAQRGVFKLVHFASVGGLVATLGPVARKEVECEVKGETVVALVKTLEYASNNNGFPLKLFSVVADTITKLVAYLRATRPELVVDTAEDNA